MKRLEKEGLDLMPIATPAFCVQKVPLNSKWLSLSTKDRRLTISRLKGLIETDLLFESSQWGIFVKSEVTTSVTKRASLGRAGGGFNFSYKILGVFDERRDRWYIRLEEMVHKC